MLTEYHETGQAWMVGGWVVQVLTEYHETGLGGWVVQVLMEDHETGLAWMVVSMVQVLAHHPRHCCFRWGRSGCLPQHRLLLEVRPHADQ